MNLGWQRMLIANGTDIADGLLIHPFIRYQHPLPQISSQRFADSESQ
jgi:hypothetical protein